MPAAPRPILEVRDLRTYFFPEEGTVKALRPKGVRFRNEIVTGIGSKQILVEDPAGNVVELFEPIRSEARLSR